MLQLRPTPPHLTSAAAEALLAHACENESNNAKRMRMGLEPIPVSTPPEGRDEFMNVTMILFIRVWKIVTNMLEIHLF